MMNDEDDCCEVTLTSAASQELVRVRADALMWAVSGDLSTEQILARAKAFADFILEGKA